MIGSHLKKTDLRDLILKLECDWRFAGTLHRNLRAVGWEEWTWPDPVMEPFSQSDESCRIGESNKEVIRLFLNHIREELESTHVLIVFCNGNQLWTDVVWSTGFGPDSLDREWVKANSSLLIRVAAERGILSDRVIFPGQGEQLPEQSDPTPGSLIAAPITVVDNPIGVLVVGNGSKNGFDGATAHVLKEAAFVLGQTLLTVIAEEENYRVLYAMIQSLVAALDARDAYTRGHSDRVALYAIMIANELGVDPEADSPGGFRDKLRLAGLFHDIGKIGVRDSILLKPGKLTDEEYNEIKKHPVVGSEIVKSSGILDHVIPGILYHHERADGSGYPIGIKGDEIPLIARIIGLVDTFDAMTTDRAFRSGIPFAEAITRMKGYSGTLFEPEMIDALVRLYESGELESVMAWGVARRPGVESETLAIEESYIGIETRIPVIPEAVTRLDAMVQDPESDIKEIAEVIQVDGGLSARVLRISNSAFYGMPGRISTIQMAISVLGLGTLRNIVVLSAIMEMSQSMQSNPESARILWEHGLKTGVWSRVIARRVPELDPETAFTAGLMHDIGKGLILRELPEEREQVRKWLFHDEDTRAIEREAMGFDHTQFGGWVAARWKLPNSLVQSIRWHHEPDDAPPMDPEDNLLLRIVCVSNILAMCPDGTPGGAAECLGREATRATMDGLPTLDDSVLEELVAEYEKDLEVAMRLFGSEAAV